MIATQAGTSRALPAETIAALAKSMVADVKVIKDVGQALAHAVHAAAPGSLTLVAGSLYVVGEAKAALERRTVQPG